MPAKKISPEKLHGILTDNVKTMAHEIIRAGAAGFVKKIRDELPENVSLVYNVDDFTAHIELSADTEEKDKALRGFVRSKTFGRVLSNITNKPSFLRLLNNEGLV